jgi:hypothetical protein
MMATTILDCESLVIKWRTGEEEIAARFRSMYYQILFICFWCRGWRSQRRQLIGRSMVSEESEGRYSCTIHGTMSYIKVTIRAIYVC